ncbi:MAG: formyltetrahydrofolate deformylase [Verrucomicrobiales bacterium]
MSHPPIIALLHGPDRPGLVAKVSGWIFENGGNIIHADQHNDAQFGVFFQRVEWAAGGSDPQAEASAFAGFARAALGMEARTALKSHRPRLALMVSHHVHACHELLLNWRAGDLRGDVVGLLSNHEIMRPTAQGLGLPFHHLNITASTRATAEREQLQILHEWGVELVVLARYMQILSAGFLEGLGCPVINIHHSFLPAFAGARPYHQAHRRGVKIIGATAHYVTPVLDEGPIIHQEVRRVSHRDAVGDLLRKGRDLEKSVLAEAVRLHLESRVLVYENKTVVFD